MLRWLLILQTRRETLKLRIGKSTVMHEHSSSMDVVKDAIWHVAIFALYNLYNRPFLHKILRGPGVTWQHFLFLESIALNWLTIHRGLCKNSKAWSHLIISLFINELVCSIRAIRNSSEMNDNYCILWQFKSCWEILNRYHNSWLRMYLGSFDSRIRKDTHTH